VQTAPPSDSVRRLGGGGGGSLLTPDKSQGRARIDCDESKMDDGKEEEPGEKLEMSNQPA